MLANKKAVSSLILIILLLCSAVIGGFVSYLWVMSNYYNMPENTTMLVVEDVTFPLYNATYFDATILNPSNSASDVNITAISLSVVGTNKVDYVTTTEPTLSTISRGTRQTFECFQTWGDLEGENVRVEPVIEAGSGNVSISSFSYVLPKAELSIQPNFLADRTVENFSLSVQNSADSVINLTVSDIMLFGTAISQNVTPSLPMVLAPNQNQTFQCNQNWSNLNGVNVTITVKTSEGYQFVCATGELPGAVLSIGGINFDYEDTSHFNLTISSSGESTTAAILDRVDLTFPNASTITLPTSPPLNITNFPIYVPQNQSLSINCTWDWKAYRNEAITVTVYTKQGFTVPNDTLTTPLAVIWNVTNAKFDLDDMEHFLVNVTNMACSIQNVTVANVTISSEQGNIGINQTLPEFPHNIIPTETQTLNCTFDWKPLRGKSANITVLTQDGSSKSINITIPSVELSLLGNYPTFGDMRDQYVNITVPIPYVDIMISNSNNSFVDVNITRIVFETENGTYEIDGTLAHPAFYPSPYILKTGENVTLLCQWDWRRYLALSLKVTVYTAQGFQVSRTWYAPWLGP
jgi:hypothetical protein